jgi:hypothetical protein
MWAVFKDTLENSAPNQFDVPDCRPRRRAVRAGRRACGHGARQSLRACLDLGVRQIAKLVPAFSIFTAGYAIREPQHQQKAFNGPIGAELFKAVSEQMDATGAFHGLPRHTPAQSARGPQGADARRPQGREAAHARQQGMAVPRQCTGRHGHATGLRRSFYWASRPDTIDGQDNPLPTTRRQVLRGDSTARAVRGVLLVDSLFITMSNKSWNALCRRRSSRSALRRRPPAKSDDDSRIKEEGQLLDFFRQQGLQVSTPDVDAFRKAVQAAYAQSEYGPGLASRSAGPHRRHALIYGSSFHGLAAHGRPHPGRSDVPWPCSGFLRSRSRPALA